MTTETNEIVWRPTAEVAERSRIARFMRAQRIGSLAELHARSVADPEWYWDAVVRDLGVRGAALRPRARRLARRGVAGVVPRRPPELHGQLCRSPRGRRAWRQARDGLGGRRRAVAHADVRELAGEVNRLANALQALGVGEGDRVGIFLPMSPEAAIAMLAVVRIGAIYTPCFSGFGAEAVASRLSDCEAKLAHHRRRLLPPRSDREDEGSRRRGRGPVPLGAARAGLPAPGREIPWTAGRDRWWHEAVAGQSDRAEALAVEADRPCLIIYTSGTTGRPKGAVLTHGGFLIKTAHDFGYCFDVGEGDRLFWLTDLGWLMGPMAITGALLPRRHRGDVRGRAGLSEARSSVEHHRAPPHQRARHLAHGRARAHAARRRAGARPRPVVAPHPGLDRRAVEPGALPLALRERGQGALPIINYTGGTEISGGILGCFPIAPIKPCSFSGPIPGMAAECFGDDGTPVRGQVGELVITRPWPGMTAGFWRDPERYERDVLVALARRLGPRRLGLHRPRRLLVHPGPLRRHAEDRRQAAGAGRGRIGAGRPPGRGGVGA